MDLQNDAMVLYLLPSKNVLYDFHLAGLSNKHSLKDYHYTAF